MIIRYTLFVILELYLQLVATPPTKGVEMGRCEGDISSNTATNTSFLRYCSFNIIYTLYKLMHVYFLSFSPLTFLDWLLFSVATFGILIRLWSYYELGNLYTFDIGIRKDHKIISTGPYRYLAHPGYWGQYLVMICAGFFYGPFISLNILITCVLTYMFYKRIIVEEGMLHNYFGEEYRIYLARN